MADFLVQATLSNLLVSTILAVIAWVVQRRVRSASLANLLWAIVLIKMVTPPLFSLPVVEVPSVAKSSVQASASLSELPPMNPTNLVSSVELALPTTQSRAASDRFWARPSQLAIVVWIAVSALLFFVSAFRILRFHWLLKANSHVHHELSSGLSADVAKQLGLPRNPQIVVTSAHIAPFVWWLSGRSIIVVSEQAIQQLNDRDLRFVLTHEMAHIKRRDHWLRWLEWFALIGLWWNPVMWWARAQMRISEEMACDQLVLETTHPEVHQYANSLLNMAELLSSPAIRPPVVASAINSGGNLERRLKMMIAEKTWKVPVALRLGIVAMALCVLPLGLVCAQDFHAVEQRLEAAVEASELTLEQAAIMMNALKRSTESQRADHQDHRNLEARKPHYLEVAKEIEAAVKAGKLSKQEAKQKLSEVRKQMFGDAGEKKVARGEKSEAREVEAKKQRYIEFLQEIEAAVEVGKISKAEAEQKLSEVRKQMFDVSGQQKAARGGLNREIEAMKRLYMQVAQEIEAAVEAGKLSKEEAEKKLNAIRKQMFSDASQKARGEKSGEREMEARKSRYQKAAKRIKSAVEKGDLSAEQGEQELIELRQEILGDGK